MPTRPVPKTAASIVASLALALACASTAAGQQAAMKVILDTDIGSDIDDAWALGFLIAAPAVDLVGVTISDGDTPARAKVACKLLHVTGRDDVAVAVGRQTPPPDQVDYQFTWAEDFTVKRPVEQPAAEFLVDALRRSPGEITVIAVGPLQNLADALRLEPKLGTLARRIVLMSGSIGANAWSPTPFAEWNVVRAVEDAQVVYGSGIPLTIVPLDATTYVTLRQDERDQLRDHPAPLTRSLEALYRLWLNRPDSRMTLHDQLAVAEALRPGEFFGRCEQLRVRVDDKGYQRVDEDGQPVTVCFEPRRDAFMRYYIDGLKR